MAGQARRACTVMRSCRQEYIEQINIAWYAMGESPWLRLTYRRSPVTHPTGNVLWQAR